MGVGIKPIPSARTPGAPRPMQCEIFFERLLNHNTNPGHVLCHSGEAIKGIDAIGTQPGPNRELNNSPVL